MRHVTIAWQVRRTSNIPRDTFTLKRGQRHCPSTGYLSGTSCGLPRHKLNVINQQFVKGGWRLGVRPSSRVERVRRPAVAISCPSRSGSLPEIRQGLPDAGEMALDEVVCQQDCPAI